jgi:hypothetical protein
MMIKVQNAPHRCDRCEGTGIIESSDSTDDSWWDCPTCSGTGTVVTDINVEPTEWRVVMAHPEHGDIVVVDDLPHAAAGEWAAKERKDYPHCTVRVEGRYVSPWETA